MNRACALLAALLLLLSAPAAAQERAIDAGPAGRFVLELPESFAPADALSADGSETLLLCEGDGVLTVQASCQRMAFSSVEKKLREAGPGAFFTTLELSGLSSLVMEPEDPAAFGADCLCAVSAAPTRTFLLRFRAQGDDPDASWALINDVIYSVRRPAETTATPRAGRFKTPSPAPDATPAHTPAPTPKPTPMRTSTPQPTAAPALVIPEGGRVSWESSGSKLNVRFQVKNESATRTVKAFELYVYTTDVWGDPIYGENIVYYGTTTRTVKPGETVYSSAITIPDRTSINRIYYGIHRMIYTDDTTVVVDEPDYWYVEYK